MAAEHTAASALADEIDAPDERARADAGLGHAYRALGDLGAARIHYERALAGYTALGTPEAEELRARLAALDGHP